MTPLAVAIAATVGLGIGGGTAVEFGPSDIPGALGQVSMDNRQVNNSADNREFTLRWQGHEVTVFFTWNADGSDADRIEVVPPPGMIAVPEYLDCPEENVERGIECVITIFPLMG